jgi:hypothetical protein
LTVVAGSWHDVDTKKKEDQAMFTTATSTDWGLYNGGEDKDICSVLPIMMEKKDKPPKTNIELELHCSR